MTDKTQPEALRLADAIKASGQFTNLHTLDEASAELRRQHARIAELEAVGAGGVQALGATPAGWRLVPVEPTNDMQKAADEWAAKGFDWPKAVYRAMLAASPTPTPTPPAEQQAAPKAAPLQQEWRLVLPGGKHTDEWESARVGDYNRGWNDYRKAAIAALNSVVWPARASGNWVAASTWLRNNYQDYPNITSLCDAMLEAAPQQEAQKPCQTCIAMARTVMMDQVSFDRKPDCYGIRQVTDVEGVEEWEDIRTSPDVAREEANDMMATGRGEVYEVVPLWTTPQPAPAPLSDDAVKDAARYAARKQGGA